MTQVPPQNEKRISELIELTSDPVQRATLLVLHKIDAGLHANTKVTMDMAEAFETHCKAFEDYRRKDEMQRAGVRGAIWGGMAIVGLLQIIAGALLGVYIKANDIQDLRIEAAHVELRAMDKRLQVVEITLREHLTNVRENGQPKGMIP